MGRLSNISGREAVKLFLKIGYRLARQEGSHIILVNERPGLPILSPTIKNLPRVFCVPKSEEPV